MIITRTPLRVSLLGGGTDLPAFYNRYPGCVLTTAIDKYVYVAINPRFDGTYRISYSRTENVQSVDKIQHDIIREAMRLFTLKGLEVVTVADVPGEGTGLGSSSALAVGVINALFAFTGKKPTARQLAELAYEVEANGCGKPVGKQDHYAAAYGGFLRLDFERIGVDVRTFSLLDEAWAMLARQMMLFWTEKSRDSAYVLRGMYGPSVASSCMRHGQEMAELARFASMEVEAGNFRHFGKAIYVSWELKKKLSVGVSNPEIDRLVCTAIEAGAVGAKICGAGGGGFLLVMAEPEKHAGIEAALGLRRLPIRIKAPGSKVIYSEES